MYFYEVWVRSNHYHGSAGLTYRSKAKLKRGQLVMVPLRHETVIAVVMAPVVEPDIKTKDIIEVTSLTPLPETTLKLMAWLKAYYPAPVGIIVQQFIPPTIKNSAPPHQTYKLSPPTVSDLPLMTSEQQTAYKQMLVNNTFVLHGRTGSGKTRIYLELAVDTINQGHSVILLTPEISLTAQLEENFKQVFGKRVVIVHSTLTPKERSERWIKLLESKEPMVVVGPRSAVFSPLKDIGLIVVDEEHEPAYKQEQAPYYQTLRVAAKLRDIHGGKLVLGSATPLVADYFTAIQLGKPILRLLTVAQSKAESKPDTTVIDYRDRGLFSRSSIISQPLIEAMESALKSGNQILLYLNRRGTARVIVCDRCDWQAHCPRCDLPLTYHGDNHTLRCHTCGFSMATPVSCSKCQNPSIRYLSIGTKAVVEEVHRLFADARVQRFDADNLKSDRLEKNYEQIKNGSIDIIVGTQMLAKGLDLPKLSVVGVLLADTSLQLPDFTANERTFQLLEQVIGRIGRGHVKGKAVVQTYQPENTTIQAALVDDWESFYKNEVKERELYKFPPFSHLLKLMVQRATPVNAEKAADKFATSLRSQGIDVDGPAPAFHEKQSGKYRWQLVIRSKDRSRLVDIANNLPAGWAYDIDPADLM